MFNLRLSKLLVSLVVLFFVSGASISSAEPLHHLEEYKAPGHDQFHHWYQHIQKELGLGSDCCEENSQDCGPVTDYLDLGNNNVWVFLEDNQGWHRVSSEASIIYIVTPDGKAHACRKPIFDQESKVWTDYFQFFCVFLPIPQIY